MMLASAALTLALAIAYIVGNQWPLMQRLEGQLLDLRFHLRGIEAPHQDIALVLVDENSLHRYGRWPISRKIFADLIDRLNADKARAVTFDFLFSEPEIPLPADLRLALQSMSLNPSSNASTSVIRNLLTQTT